MSLPSVRAFGEVRRFLPVLAATLLVTAVFLPMWVITVHAIQYPGEPLTLQLYAYPHIAGDYWEMAELNQYIGFYFPDPVYWQPNYEVHEAAIDVPEWSLGPLAFLVVALTGVFVAVAPTVEKLKLGLKWQLVGAVTVFTVMVADIQYRLYQAGHTLDPNAPVVGVDPFTPPIWGQYEVANITSQSRFGLGAYLAVLAIGLLVLAYHYRDTDASMRTLPSLVRTDLNRVRRRFGGGEDEETTPGPTPERR